MAGLEHVQQSELQKRALAGVSDGGYNASSHTLKETLDMTAESNTLIYSVGIYNEFGRDHNPKVLKQLANATGGEAYFPRSASQLSDTLQLNRNRHAVAVYPGIYSDQSEERWELPKDPRCRQCSGYAK